jgi:glycosyltransferase involved in cell wall biosynthesis
MIEHSVLVYSRHGSRFISGCIESLLDQAQPPDEILVIEVQSDDGTHPSLQRFGTRVRTLSVRARSDACSTECEALKTGFAASHGRFIFLVEACDRFKRHKIERYTAAFDANPDASVVQAPLDTINEDGEPIGCTLVPAYHVTNHLREIYRRHDVNFFYPMSALAFSRYYLERIVPFELDDELPLWADARLCLPAAYYGRIVTLPDPLTDRRVRGVIDPDVPHGRDAVEQTLLRARVFNRFCRRHGLRPISPWRNVRLYAQLLQCVMPARSARYLRRQVRSFSDRV